MIRTNKERLPVKSMIGTVKPVGKQSFGFMVMDHVVDGRDQGVDDLVQLSVQNRVQPVAGQADPVLHHLALEEAVGPNLLAAPRAAHLAFPL